jgi:hypothetical protein
MMTCALADIAAAIVGFIVHLSGNLCGKYASGYGNNGITSQHSQGSNHLP